jgi:hypothetical protein
VERNTFTQGMSMLAATWPDRSPSAQTTAAYWLALSHLDDTTFGEAVTRCLRECRFFPAPAELLSRAETALTSAGRLPMEPESAWRIVADLSRNWHPAMLAPEWPDADISRTVRELGGLRRIALSDDDGVTWIRKEFVARYGEYRRRRIAEDISLMSQPLPERAATPALAGAGR